MIFEHKKIKSFTVSVVFPAVMYSFEGWNITKAEKGKKKEEEEEG